MVDGSCKDAPIPFPPVAPVSFHADILLLPNKPSPPNKSLLTLVFVFSVAFAVVAFAVCDCCGAFAVVLGGVDEAVAVVVAGVVVLELGSYLQIHGGHGGAL